MRSEVPASSAMKAGTWPAVLRRTGPSAPLAAHHRAVPSGASSAEATTRAATGWRQPKAMPATRALAPSAPIAAAASSAMPLSRVAGPAQAATGRPPEAGVTLVPATTTAKSRQAPAAPQAASTARRRSARSSAASAASTTPAESQTGGTPAPPGLTSSRPSGAARWPSKPGRPASSSSREGWPSTCRDQGASTRTGTPSVTATRSPSSRSASAPEP